MLEDVRTGTLPGTRTTVQMPSADARETNAMNPTHTRHRVSIIRKVGWLSVASMLALALLAPGANAQTGHPDDQSWDSVSQDCTGGPNGNITPVDGMIAWVFVHSQVAGPGTLTAQFANAGQQTASSYIQGGVKYIIWTPSPDTLLSFSDNLNTEAGHDQLVLSHVCVGETTTTSSSTTTQSSTTDPSTTTESSTTESTTTKSTSSVESTTTVSTTSESSTETSTTSEASSTTTEQASSSVEATTSEVSSTTSNDQQVAGETDVPTVTLPPTDTLGGPAAPSSDSWRLFLIVGAALVASALVLTPATATRRR
jgi:hypothetical protein